MLRRRSRRTDGKVKQPLLWGCLGCSGLCVLAFIFLVVLGTLFGHQKKAEGDKQTAKQAAEYDAMQQAKKAREAEKTKQLAAAKKASTKTPTQKPATKPAPKAPLTSAVAKLVTSVLNEEIVDKPVKAQVKRCYLVSGHLTEAGLKEFLLAEHRRAKSRKGFRYHKAATNIYLYCYTSKEHLEDGMGSWVAMLSRGPDDSGPSFTAKSGAIEAAMKPPEAKFGLSEDKRKKIWQESVKIEDRAQAEADAAFPLQPERALNVGSVMQLKKQTPLCPEFDPGAGGTRTADEILRAVARIVQLPTGSWIKVEEVRKKGIEPWYRVIAKTTEGASLGNGWINCVALAGQFESDFKKTMKGNAEMSERLRTQYEQELLKKHGLSDEQLTEISGEGLTKNWPFPK